MSEPRDETNWQPPQPGANGQASYGYGQPPPPPWAQSPGRPAEMPKSVNIGSWLILASAAISAVMIVINLVTDNFFDQAQAQMEAQGAPDVLDFSTIRIIQIVSGIFGIAFTIGLYFLIFYFIRKGKNWARIVGTVFAGLAIIQVPGSLMFFGSFDFASTIPALLLIAGVVMLYLRESNPWFRKAVPSYGPPMYGPPQGGQPSGGQPYPGQPGPNLPPSGITNQNPSDNGPTYGN